MAERIEFYQVAQRKIRRELARRRCLDFISYTKPGWQTARHHDLMAGVYERLLYKPGTFAVVSMPPRHGKSEIFSIRLVAHYLGLYPGRQVIHISHSAALSNGFSREVRALIRDSVRYRELFPQVVLSKDRARIDDWRTVQGGGMLSLGTGGGVTGYGGDLIVVDDPVKEGDENSPSALLEQWAWFMAAVRTRLSPVGSIAIVMTRWAPGDLAGRALASVDGADADPWEFLVLKGLAEEGDVLGRQAGEALWEARVPARTHRNMRQLQPRYFAALIQQEPQPQVTAMFFERDLVRFPVGRARGGRGVWCFDLAMDEGEVADYSVWARVKLTRSRRLVFTEVGRVQQGWPRTMAAIKALVVACPRDKFVFPKHVLENLALQELVAAYPDRRGDFETVSFPARSDKRSRARVLEGAAEGGRLWVERSETGDEMVAELVAFPGDHDDCVDMATVAAWYYGLQKEARFDFVGQSEVKSEWARVMERWDERNS